MEPRPSLRADVSKADAVGIHARENGQNRRATDDLHDRFHHKKSPSSPAPRAASGLRPQNDFSPRAGGWRCSTSRRDCCTARSPGLAEPDTTLALHCDVSDADGDGGGDGTR